MPTLSVNDHDIHYASAGSGPPLVFIHSLGSSMHMWREQLAALSQTFEVIVFDLRGHGQSGDASEFTIGGAARDMKALLDHLNVTKCDCIGIAMGGQIALEFNANFPDAVRSLVLADTSVRLSDENTNYVTATREAIAYISMREFGVQYAAQNLVPSTSFSMQDELAGAVARVPPKIYVQGMIASLQTDFTPLLAKVKCPTLILYGKDDDGSFQDDSAFVADNIPKSQREALPDAGRLSCLENPVAFTDALSRFIGAL